MERTRLIHDLVLSAMAAAMLVWAITLWSRSAITAGDVVVVSALTFRILHGSRDLAMAFVDTVQSVAFIRETLHQVGKAPDVCDAPGSVALPRAGGHRPVRDAVRLRDVSFSYPGGQQVVSGVSLSIPPGQKVGVVGASGAGKSTLVSLIQRLHDVDAGEVSVLDRPVLSVTQDSLRDVLGVVPQEVTLFHRSIMENI